MGRGGFDVLDGALGGTSAGASDLSARRPQGLTEAANLLQAGQAMAQLSSFLAEQLDAAARIYAGVDQQESADIARSEISTDE